MSEVSVVKKALDFFDGSPTKMAAAIGRNVKRQHVEHWVKAGSIPETYCPAVSTLTGIPLWRLRPDDWHHAWPMLIGSKGAPRVPEAKAA